MAEKRVQRRLAAIMAADVVGYGRLMEQKDRQWASESSIAVLSFTNFSGDPAGRRSTSRIRDAGSIWFASPRN